jgi:hypothetical protein
MELGGIQEFWARSGECSDYALLKKDFDCLLLSASLATAINF